MARTQALIKELLKNVNDEELENGNEKEIVVILDCGSKIHVLVKIEGDKKPKLKIVKDAS